MKKNNMIIVIGHKNPDSDSAISALIMSKYLNSQGTKSVARLATEANKEIEYVFSFFEEEPLKVIDESEINGKNLFLVDHNDLLQSVAKEENIYGVLDHHALAGVKTDLPIFFRVEPIGSTSSLVYKMIKESTMTPDKKEAGLLLAGIISDTQNLNSPTCTEEDRIFYQELVSLSGVDTDKLYEGMLEAKSDFSGKSMNEIVCADLKFYDFNNKAVGIGVAETSSLSYFNGKKEEIVEAMKKVKREKDLSYLFFGLVDLVNQNTYFYPADEDEESIIAEVFKVKKEEDGFFFLEGVSSRKKEIGPPIQRYFNN